MADSMNGRDARIRTGVHRNAPAVFIPLTHGREAVIDPEDWQRIAEQYGSRWLANTNGSGRWYARKNIKRPDGRVILLTLARAVTGAKDGECVKAVNGDTLDCRRSNLHVERPKEAAKTRAHFINKSRPEPRP